MDEAKENGPDWADEEHPTLRDQEVAEEIARFIAKRAFAFEDHECRAWALSDFEVWATLAGREPELGFVDEDAIADHLTTTE